MILKGSPLNGQSFGTPALLYLHKETDNARVALPLNKVVVLGRKQLHNFTLDKRVSKKHLRLKARDEFVTIWWTGTNLGVIIQEMSETVVKARHQRITLKLGDSFRLLQQSTSQDNWTLKKFDKSDLEYRKLVADADSSILSTDDAVLQTFLDKLSDEEFDPSQSTSVKKRLNSRRRRKRKLDDEIILIDGDNTQTDENKKNVKPDFLNDDTISLVDDEPSRKRKRKNKNVNLGLNKLSRVKSRSHVDVVDVSQPIEPTGWGCPDCTFINDIANLSCEMCHTRKCDNKSERNETASSATSSKGQHLPLLHFANNVLNSLPSSSRRRSQAPLDKKFEEKSESQTSTLQRLKKHRGKLKEQQKSDAEFAKRLAKLERTQLFKRRRPLSDSEDDTSGSYSPILRRFPFGPPSLTSASPPGLLSSSPGLRLPPMPLFSTPSSPPSSPSRTSSPSPFSSSISVDADALYAKKLADEAAVEEERRKKQIQQDAKMAEELRKQEELKKKYADQKRKRDQILQQAQQSQPPTFASFQPPYNMPVNVNIAPGIVYNSLPHVTRKIVGRRHRLFAGNGSQSSCELPPMQSTAGGYDPRDLWPDRHVKEVQYASLDPSQEMFKRVSELFNASVPSSSVELVDISVICSPDRLEGYNLRRRQFEKILDNRLNERWLWHGTSSEVAERVCHQGFLRQFQQTSAHGNGTYFAEHANYSAQPGYAKIDEKQEQRVLLCRVICGDFHKGYQGLIQPNVKPGKKHDVHESVVDCVQRPSMFIVFLDDQAYPEFQITFKRTHGSRSALMTHSLFGFGGGGGSFFGPGNGGGGGGASNGNVQPGGGGTGSGRTSTPQTSGRSLMSTVLSSLSGFPRMPALSPPPLQRRKGKARVRKGKVKKPKAKAKSSSRSVRSSKRTRSFKKNMPSKYSDYTDEEDYNYPDEDSM